MIFKTLFFVALCVVIKSEIVYAISKANHTSPVIKMITEIPSATVHQDKDLKSVESRLLHNPLPGHYKGPTNSAELNRDRNRNRYGLGRSNLVEHSDGGFVTSHGSATYENSRYTPATAYGFKDRIIVGNYGGNDNRYNEESGNHNPRSGAYGPPQVVEYDSSYDGHGLDWGSNDIYRDGNGGHNSITIVEKHVSNSPLLPLAGAALLGIAAILVTNPVLVPFGAVAGKRKRRDVEESKKTSSRKLAYSRQNRRYNE